MAHDGTHARRRDANESGAWIKRWIDNNETCGVARRRAGDDLGMSTHENAEILLAWIRERSGATVSEIVASGLMKSRTASDAIQYAVRSGALERVVRVGATAKERMQYRATGVALPTPRISVVVPSFDGLLEAWGITREPVALEAKETHRHQISDNE